jgi:hypothetical protein
MDLVRPAPGLLEISLASEDETARLGRAIAEIVEVGTVIGLVGPLEPARPGWSGRSPRRSGSSPTRSRARRSS